MTSIFILNVSCPITEWKLANCETLRRYTCVARNMVGEASKNFTVEVEDYIIVTIVIIVILIIIIIIIVIIIIRWRTRRPSRRTSPTRR